VAPSPAYGRSPVVAVLAKTCAGSQYAMRNNRRRYGAHVPVGTEPTSRGGYVRCSTNVSEMQRNRTREHVASGERNALPVYAIASI